MGLTFVVGLTVTAARASLWIEFDPPRAPSGGSVEGRTLGNGALRGVGERNLPIFFFAARVKGPRSLHDERLVPIGDLSVDDSGNGVISFRVPELRTGKYHVIVHCRPCAASSAGRELLPVGEFKVQPGGGADPASRASDRGAGSNDVSIWWLVLVVLLLGIFALPLWRRMSATRS